MSEDLLYKQLEAEFGSYQPDDEEELYKQLQAEFGGMSGLEELSYAPAQATEEPGLVGRFTGSFAQSFARGMRGIPAGVGSGLASLTGNEEMFDAQIQELQRITDEVSSYNPNPSSFAEVREKFTAGGLLPAAGEILDLAVQGIGGSLGYMAPSLALAGVGTAALGSTAVAAPWIALAAFGGAGVTRFAQYFSEQMEESYTYAQQEGREVDIADINLANQVLSSAGQTLLEAAPVLGAGLLKNVAKSTVVQGAANTAAARTVIKAAEQLDNPSRLVHAARATGAELFTEQGQNLLQRAAAGQPIDPSDQEAFNSYLETFVSTLLTAGAFGAASAYMNVDSEKPAPPPTMNPDAPMVAMTGDPFVDSLALAQPYQVPAPKPVEGPFLAPGLAPTSERQNAQTAAADVARQRAAKAEQKRIAGIERTVNDVVQVLKDRNIDYDSDAEARAGLAAIVQEETKKSRLQDATPAEIERVYERIAALQRSETKTKLPLASESESFALAKSIAPSKRRGKPVNQKPRTVTNLVSTIEERLKKRDKTEKIVREDGLYKLRAREIVNQMQRAGLLIEKGKGLVFDVEAISLATDPSIAKITDAVEAILDSRGIDDKKAGEFPSYKEVEDRLGEKFNKNFLTQIKDAYLRRGLIEKRDGKFIDRRFLDQIVKDQKKTKPARVLPTRTTHARTGMPARRWVVRDRDTGEIIPGGILKSKSEADKFAAEKIPVPQVSQSTVTPSMMKRGLTPEASLVKPPPTPQSKYIVKPERGFVVEERQYSGDKLVDTKMKDFVPYDKDAAGKADDLVRAYESQREQSVREAQPEYLGDQRIDSPTQKRIVREARRKGAEAKYRAIHSIMSSPGHVSAVLNRYGLGIDMNGPEVKNVPVNSAASLGIKKFSGDLKSIDNYDAKSRPRGEKLPMHVAVYHAGSRSADSPWASRGKHLRTGEGYKNPPLGEGVYFSTSEVDAAKYLKYGGDRPSISKVVLDTRDFVEAHGDDPKLSRLRNLAILRGADPDQVSANLAIRNLFSIFGNDVAHDLLSKAGIKGAYDKVANGDEISVFDPSVIYDVKNDPAHTVPNKPLEWGMDEDLLASVRALREDGNLSGLPDVPAGHTRIWGTTDPKYKNWFVSDRNMITEGDLRYLDIPTDQLAQYEGEPVPNSNVSEYSIPDDVASNANPITEESTDTTFGTLPFDQLGRRIGQSFDIVVKQGVVKPNGMGFGKARLDTQNASIAENTRFKNWKEMLDAALRKLPATKYTNTGEMTMFTDGPGRNVLIWNDPLTKEPMVFVFDYFEDGNGPQYHLYNAFVGQDYAANVENVEALRGVESRRGKNVSTDAMFALKNPAHAEQFTQAEIAQHDWSDRRKKGGGTLPVKKPSEKAVTSDKMKTDATGVKVVESKYKPKGWVHFMGKVLDIMTTAIQNWRKAPNMRKPVDVGRFRFTYIDEFDPAVKQDQRVEYDGESQYLNIAVQSEAAYRMLHRMADMFNGLSGYGMIDYYQTTPGDMANGVYRKLMQPLVNSTNMRTVRGADRNLVVETDPDGGVWTYDKDAQKRVKTNFTRNMYTEGKKNSYGGIRTIFESLKKFDKSLVPELFQYARAVRAMMLQNESAPGGPRYAGMSDQDINDGLELAAKYPEVAIAYRNLQNWNQLLIDFAQNTGLITQAEADFMRETDYTPFYLDLDKEANSQIRRMWEDQKSRFKGTGKISTMRDYDVFRDFVGFGKGSDKDIDIDEKLVDGVEATIRNAMGILTSGGRNVALYRTIRNGMAEGTIRPKEEAKRPDDGSFVKIKVNGIEQEFEVDDNLMFEMMAGVDNIPLFQAILNSPGMRALGTFPAQVLRQTVTKTPDFIIPNVLRDSVETFMINAADPRMLIDVWKRIRDNTLNPDSMTGKLLKAKGKREEFDILSLYGVSNGWDSVRSSHRIKGQADALRRAAKLPKDGHRTFEDVLADSKIWNALTDLSSASESATREVAFAHVYKRQLKRLKEKGHSDEEAAILAEAEAAHQAVEVMNFNRRGSSQGLRIFTAMAPFVNARIQGVDKLARAGMKLAPVGYDRLDADTVFKNLMNRGKWLAAGSAALAMLNFGDDEYEREHGYRRDDHWFIPIPGTTHFLTIPIPFELGTLFKTVPEQLTRATLKIATGDASAAGRDALRAATHVATTNFGVGSIIPVSARPIIEWGMNQNLHTGVPIDPYWEQDLDAEDRYGPRTTVAARLLGQVTGPVAGLSPRYLDNLVGTIGGGLLTMLWGVADHMARAPGLVTDEWIAPPRPAPSARDIILLRRILSSPSTATGVEAEYYEFKKELDRIYRLVNDAQGESRFRLAEKYSDELAARAKMQPVDRQMRRLRDLRKSILENKEFKGPYSLKAELDMIRQQQRDPMDQFRAIRKEYDRS